MRDKCTRWIMCSKTWLEFYVPHFIPTTWKLLPKYHQQWNRLLNTWNTFIQNFMLWTNLTSLLYARCMYRISFQGGTFVLLLAWLTTISHAAIQDKRHGKTSLVKWQENSRDMSLIRQKIPHFRGALGGPRKIGDFWRIRLHITTVVQIFHCLL